MPVHPIQVRPIWLVELRAEQYQQTMYIVLYKTIQLHSEAKRNSALCISETGTVCFPPLQEITPELQENTFP